MEYQYFDLFALPDFFQSNGDDRQTAFAKAYGAIWGHLTQEQKAKVFRSYGLEMPEVEII